MERTFIRDLKEKAGEKVLIKGWVDIRRDHGKLIFFDLRDFSGMVQAVSTPKGGDVHETANFLRPEWVIEVIGTVNERPANMVNEDLPNGSIELKIEEVKILNEAVTPPIDVRGDGRDIGEESRLKYRYLDLRRPRMQKNLRDRSNVFKFIRDYLINKDFVEIETPILSKSTPEGARDFLVPSRLDRGKFYALPQSPQQYKQLLMVSGFERYFQIARCMRDEDTRGDRQAEFTQLDIEMSFPSQEEILNLVEGMYMEIIKKFYPEKKVLEIPWPRLSYDEAMEKYGKDSPDLRKDKNDPNELAFAWVLGFPLFEKKMVNNHYAPSHHMFTAPREEDLEKLSSAPGEVKAYQHDLVLNGNEIAGGSIRIHQRDLQEKIFDLIGFDKKKQQEFKHMLEAFTYGVPPHGGIAGGMERFLMILEGEESIREVMAFPKTGEGKDLMMEAPSEVEDGQLKELGIEIKKK